MKQAHKKLLKLIQIVVVTAVIVTVSGTIAGLGVLFGALTIDEYADYVIGLMVGSSLVVVGGRWLKKEWDILMDKIEGNDDKPSDLISRQDKIEELKRLLRK